MRIHEDGGDEPRRSRHARAASSPNKHTANAASQILCGKLNFQPGTKVSRLLRQFISDVLAKGERGDVALGHCMRKLLHLVYAVWKTGKPFDAQHYSWIQDNDSPATETPAATTPRSASSSISFGRRQVSWLYLRWRTRGRFARAFGVFALKGLNNTAQGKR